MAIYIFMANMPMTALKMLISMSMGQYFLGISAVPKSLPIY